jgi:Tfp pilus assembly protein PilV
MNIFVQKNIKKCTTGFTLVEVLIACSIITMTIFALFSAAQKGVSVSNQALRQTQAITLLEEGADAVKSIRDTQWSTIANLTDGATYYLSFDNSTNVWTLTTTPAQPIDGIFKRSLVFQTATRDSNDDLALGGTPDDHTKKVSVTVTFPSSNGVISKTLDLYLSDIF